MSGHVVDAVAMPRASYPQLEAAATAHPAVLEAVVIPLPPAGAQLAIAPRPAAKPLANAGLEVLDSRRYLRLRHRVDQAIIRDVMVARKPV